MGMCASAKTGHTKFLMQLLLWPVGSVMHALRQSIVSLETPFLAL
jgi:hypothetical protein